MEYTCPICGRRYSSPPAMNRVDNATLIRPVCRAKESLFFLPEDEQVKIIADIEAQEIAHGQVEAIPLA